jgi:putative salt-induced outer membrane protein YdiY
LGATCVRFRENHSTINDCTCKERSVITSLLSSLRGLVRRALIALSLAIVLSSTVFADQVVLKNGDRLTGTILKSDGKDLVLKTEFIGEVTIRWDAVQGMTSSEELHLGLKSGQKLVGQVSTTDGTFVVATKSGGNVETPKDSISVIRNNNEQLAYDKSLNPGLSEGWTGGTNVGFALTRGNSQTKNLSLAFNAARKTLNDKLGLYMNTVYATNDAPGAVPSTTANAIQGGLRYDHDITPRVFGFGSADFQEDSLQSLNLRSIFGGGLGFHMIKSESTTLDLLGGINYTRENYDAFTRNFAAATVGEELLHKLRASTSLTQSLYFYPNLSDAGDYRSTFNFGTVTKVSKWLGWQNAFGDIYVSNPPVGKKKNDVLFTTGLNISFAH